MINQLCYHKNWSSNICSKKCKLYNECSNTWREHILTILQKKYINLSRTEVLKL